MGSREYDGIKCKVGLTSRSRNMPVVALLGLAQNGVKSMKIKKMPQKTSRTILRACQIPLAFPSPLPPVAELSLPRSEIYTITSMKPANRRIDMQ